MKKQEQPTPVPWEIRDPKPPVIQSGRAENRVRHENPAQ